MTDTVVDAELSSKRSTNGSGSRIQIVAGGDPPPEEVAALSAALIAAVASVRKRRVVKDAMVSEWALQGRMQSLHWEPLSRRWPGEPPGRAWRRAGD